MSEAWNTWEGQIVNGEFHLQRYLGGSHKSAVYLAEYAGVPPQQVAIKLVPADAVDPDFLLSRWKIAEDLLHPHLIGVSKAGRCRLDADEFLFLAMEYAEENLGQIVPERPLTSEEVRQMLDPALDALSYLHGCGLVHGSVKPANTLAVHDQLKLSADNLAKVGDSVVHYGQSGIYAPPESRYEAASPAGDVWALGVTLAEVLTQHLPRSNEQEQDDPELPAGLPAEFYEIVRGCLRSNPAHRLTVANIRSRLGLHPAPVAPPAQTVQKPEPSPGANALSATATVTPQTKPVSSPAQKPESPRRAPRATSTAPLAGARTRPLVPGIIATVAVLALALILALWGLSHRQPESSQAAGETEEKSANSGAPASPSPESDEKPSPTRSQPRNRAPSTGEVVQQQLPDVSQSARDTIHGTVRVNVKVQVDRTGSVVGSAFDHAGPSKYFSRLAMGAAHNWKFTPSGRDETREFVLHFEFTNTGTRAFATAEKG